MPVYMSTSHLDQKGESMFSDGDHVHFPHAALLHFRQQTGDRWHVSVLQTDLDEDVFAGMGCCQHLDRQEKTTEGINIRNVDLG